MRMLNLYGKKETIDLHLDFEKWLEYPKETTHLNAQLKEIIRIDFN